ncbi:MAG: hypothetical protein AAFO01_22210, partial [Pseudomonadota bacterium]
RFNAFGAGTHANAAAEADESMHDSIRLAHTIEALNEASVYLDLIERKSEQITNRGVSGTEIVERDTDTQGAQMVKR